MGQSNIQIARRLEERVIVLFMDREREHFGLLRKDRRRTVPVVQVAVDHDSSLDQSLAHQHSYGDRHVVHKAKALAVIGEGVVKASAQMNTHPPLERFPSRFDGTTDAQPHRIPQLDISVDQGGRLQLIVHFLEQDHRSLIDLLEPLAAEKNCSVYVQKGRKESIVQFFAGEDLIIEPCDDIELKFPAGGFTQVNLAQNRNLVNDVLDVVPGQANIIDLYCGIGNFSIPLAEKAANVVGVEDYAPAIEAAKDNAAQAGLDNTTFIAEDAVTGLERMWQDDCDVVVLDPPRSGAFAVVKRLVALKPGRIVYVSCDPMTLSRDLKVLLNNGYVATGLRPYDMFPQTGHIEGMVVMDRATV